MITMLSANLHGILGLQYLDPGAGSIVVQVVVAGIVGAAAVLKFYWKRITSVFARSRGQGSIDT